MSIFKKSPSDMTDRELADASFAVSALLKNREAAMADPRMNSDTRKFLNGQLPEPNKNLIEFQKQVNDEIAKRKSNVPT